MQVLIPPNTGPVRPLRLRESTTLQLLHDITPDITPQWVAQGANRILINPKGITPHTSIRAYAESKFENAR